jgi:hypothetical protein
MAGGGANEIAALLRQQLGDALGVLAAQRLAGQDHRPGIDLVGIELGGGIGLIDDLLQAGIVNALLAGIGRERHRRLVQRLARNHVVAAGQVLAIAAQVDAREDHLGAGGADVDADADQGDVVLQPDRVLLDRAVVVELEVVVVVVGVFIVLVHHIGAEQMVLQAVPGLVVVVVGISHCKFAPDGTG